MQSGLYVDGKNIPVCLMLISCDAPMSLVKVPHSILGIIAATIVAISGKRKGRITYQDVTKDFEGRSDHSFHNGTQEEHHTGNTPFVALTIGMIKAFPVDFIHQSCLGVVRKLFHI